MKVLCVDDESRVLKGLQRTLFALQPDWEVFCADGAEQALALLSEQPVDVVVSDLRMPGMDGAALLTQVGVTYPQVARLVLSGQASERTVLRTVPSAHRYLAKPCSGENLVTAIASCAALHERLQEPALQSLLGRLQIPAAPGVYSRLREAIDADGADAASLSAIVAQDPAIAAHLLRLVNSAFFGLPAPVQDIRSAVVRLGADLVSRVVLLQELLSGQHSWPTGFSPDRLQERALLVARMARGYLTDAAQGELAYNAGLLHVMGDLLLAVGNADTWANLQTAVAAQPGRPIHEVEVEVLGIPTGLLGGSLLQRWGLPAPLVDIVCRFQAPGAFGVEAGDSPARAVHLAWCEHLGREPERAELSD